MEENMSKLTMNPNYIGVVKSTAEKVTAGGILLTGNMDNDLQRCRVIYNSETDESKYQINDEVLISPRNMIKTKVTGEEFYVVKVEDVWGTFKE